jgi:hypothetical protein
VAIWLITCTFALSQKQDTSHGFLRFASDKKIGRRSAHNFWRRKQLKEKQTQNQTPFNSDTTEKTGATGSPRNRSIANVIKNSGTKIALNAIANLAVSLATALMAKYVCIASIP